MKNQGNKTSSMECNNFQKLTHKDQNICDLHDKQFKIVVLRKLSELQEKQFNKIRETS